MRLPDWLLLSAITLIGGALRFIRLGYPNAYVFDETYYARDACLYLGHTPKFCGVPTSTEISYVHPPLGKWAIALGEWIAGHRPVGWRVMAALFGTALIAVVFLLGRRLFGRWAGALADTFVATDFLLIVQSRTAMLDIFLAFWVSLGFLFVVLEWERVRAMRAAGEGRRVLRWRLLAGVAFGAAVATKWSGLYALVGAGGLLVWWSTSAALAIRQADRAAGGPHRGPDPVAELNGTLLSLGVPLVAIYLASYAAWFKDHRFSLAQFLSLQNSMYQYNAHLHASHPYASRPWSWPILERPVNFYLATSHAGTRYAHILDVGNPFTWWLSLGALAWLLYRAYRRRWGPELIVAVAWLSQYLPWLAAVRTSFFYYMTPIVPFMMLALAGGLVALAKRSRWRASLLGVYVAAACGGALWFWYPILAAVWLPIGWWHTRMLFPSWI